VIVAGHIAVADPATDGVRLLALADVICSADPGDWLTDYPGCAVAVTYQGDRLLAATRAGQVGLRGDPVIGGVFLYDWLTAGYPIALVEGRRVRASLRMVIGVRQANGSPLWPLVRRFRNTPREHWSHVP
jgi:hypothetical protein